MAVADSTAVERCPVKRREGPKVIAQRSNTYAQITKQIVCQSLRQINVYRKVNVSLRAERIAKFSYLLFATRDNFELRNVKLYCLKP